jgi:hypothetical protein
MKFLPLILLLLVFISLNASAYDPYSSESDDEVIEVDPELTDEEAQREIESASIPESTPTDSIPADSKPFEQDVIAKRLNNEMNFLSTDSQIAKVATPPQAPSTESTSKSEIADLEEKINFRAAAVKKEDNMRPDEVDATDLDSDNFE